MTDEQLIEAMARRLAKDDGANWEAAHFGETPSGETPEEMRDYYRGLATAAVATLRKTHHLVPRHTEGLTQILPMDSAPQNGAHILAKTLPRQKDDPFYSYGGRWFVTHYVGLGDWSLFPGFGVSADWFEGWARLPLAAAAEQAKQEHNLSELTGLLVDAENALTAMIRGHEDGEDLAQTVAADIRQRLGDGRDQ